ncbi:uncharacterized protein FYW49_018107 [Xenentodon cancila]
MDLRPQSAVLIATVVVVNIIWWMLMIAAIGLGATTLSLCPVQPYIPIYLLVLGAASILSLSVTYISRTNTVGAAHIFSSACMVILHLFSFAWLIAGTCWIYSVHPPNYTGPDQHCHKTTYQFAFVVTTLLWVIVSLVFLCGGCCALLTCCTTVVATRHLIPNRSSFYGATSDIQHSSVGRDLISAIVPITEWTSPGDYLPTLPHIAFRDVDGMPIWAWEVHYRCSEDPRGFMVRISKAISCQKKL